MLEENLNIKNNQITSLKIQAKNDKKLIDSIQTYSQDLKLQNQKLKGNIEIFIRLKPTRYVDTPLEFDPNISDTKLILNR